jgi:hypothetical protein
LAIFLADVGTYLSDSEYHSTKWTINSMKQKNYKDLLEQNNITLNYDPDFVLIELPALIYNNYPADLMTNADMGILVCRSNRIWTEADQSSVNNLLDQSASKIKFIVNGGA